MKFVLVTETFPPEVNGVSMTLGRLCDGLVACGWRLRVVRPAQRVEEDDLPSAPKAFEEFLVAGVPLPGYKGLRMGEPAGFSLYRNWKSDRPDVVHVATEGPLGVAALIAAKLLKIPVTSTFHTNFDQYSGHYQIGFIRKFASNYLRLVHNACELTLAPTRQMADELAAEGYRNTGVMSRGVDTELFSPAKRSDSLRGEWGIPANGKVALYVGRVAKEKNIDLAFKAFEQLRSSHGEDRMVVVGAGPELSRLQRKYPEIHYAGMKQGEELSAHYASGDIFLFPSVTETFGNVVTEAMASGLAVCAFDYAAGRQFIDSGRNGYLARFGSDEAFMAQAKALRALPESEFQSLRAAARETANGISWSSVISGFQESVAAAVEKYRRLAIANA